MRSFIVAAVAALTFTSAAHAGRGETPTPRPPPGPYKLDASGKCHAAGGQIVPVALCKPGH